MCFTPAVTCHRADLTLDLPNLQIEKKKSYFCPCHNLFDVISNGLIVASLKIIKHVSRWSSGTNGSRLLE